MREARSLGLPRGNLPLPSHEPFKTRIHRASEEQSSRVVLALDIGEGKQERAFQKSRRLLNKTIRHVCGLKFGRQTILNLGRRKTQQLIRIAQEAGIVTIIDDKLNDIDETNLQISTSYFDLGLEAIIVNPFAGWKGGLEPVFKLAHATNRGVIALVYMSHPGARESYGQDVVLRERRIPQYKVFARRAVDWRADGVIVGAARPGIIEEVRPILSTVPIYSPGVGAQGGKVQRARRAGTDYFIIGRSITSAADPGKAAREFAEESTGNYS